MTWPEGVALELIVLGIGWTGFKFLTRNVRSFLDLRLEVRRQLQRFAMDAALRPGIQRAPAGGERSPVGDSRPIDDPRLPPGSEVFRQLGFRMLMFAQNARLAAWFVKMMGYDPIKAGDNLISLSHDAGLAFRRKSIADALRFKEGTSGDSY
jgi:hypothetical protein